MYVWECGHPNGWKISLHSPTQDQTIPFSHLHTQTHTKSKSAHVHKSTPCMETHNVLHSLFSLFSCDCVTFSQILSVQHAHTNAIAFLPCLLLLLAISENTVMVQVLLLITLFQPKCLILKIRDGFVFLSVRVSGMELVSWRISFQIIESKESAKLVRISWRNIWMFYWNRVRRVNVRAFHLCSNIIFQFTDFLVDVFL